MIFTSVQEFFHMTFIFIYYFQQINSIKNINKTYVRKLINNVKYNFFTIFIKKFK